jgi:cytochrome c-type biogenesis protein CcmH/NrfG
LKFDPQRADILVELGEQLIRLDDWDRALDAYETALKLDPKTPRALYGSARIFERKRDFKSAAERLRTILRHEPTNAGAWLKLGDVAVLQGDELLARECYTRAAQIDPQAAQVAADARQRLSLMSGLNVGKHRNEP